jgi:hypothetical protein
MNAVHVTGCSGAGKTTIAAVLACRGLATIDADDDPLLARTVDAVGNVVEEQDEPEEPGRERIIPLADWRFKPSSSMSESTCPGRARSPGRS